MRLIRSCGVKGLAVFLVAVVLAVQCMLLG